ncbi:MAG: DUF2723 domain-containing protein [Gemmatimonadales bacterium]|nr:DUF2723 domain-containing protein [Gemmatimonadales bacterium]NIN11339.1 DUF2723 domain-containing protein [Gemmatimonadales bacterium]NIN49949.1 DUF2723 domain-containing protein [Gemmatimonadales bacterium]NIP07413.1 DUF2723 domain-containing protein [Gemmatimonadales bacterium]NIR00480.1 DUF2723 domain-containing protein [Gemmatimonadales bacterium]
MSSTEAGSSRPPYRAALGVFAVVLAGYLWTLAPTVTFWDAGEFIATAKILGIPHPPGTPLFVLMCNVWGSLVPIGEFAYRTNLMTAIFSAAAAALLFLLVVQALRGWAARGETGDGNVDTVFTVGGGVAAAVLSAFVFTVWQNSNETEVYMVAAFSIAAICWLAWTWRKHRGGERAPHVLLLIIFLCAVSIGAHLLTLLVGPALIGFMWHVIKTEPLPNDQDRRTEWAQWAVVLGIWALLVGIGLGSTGLLAVGGIVFLGAAVYAASAGALVFAATVLGIAVVGASTYIFLLIRANVGPFINEADPSTWESLWAVIAREQYPPRSPIDNPIYTLREGGLVERLGAFVGCLLQFKDGPVPPDEAIFGIPPCYTVRSIPLMLRQIQNYLQYFDWQWANGLSPTKPVFAPIRIPFTLAFISLGVYGAAVLRRRDRSIFWLLVILFLTTGPGLMGYMNFKPGYSLAWDVFPQLDMHEVRERDYFFTVSFQLWGLFAGIGLAGVYRLLREQLGGAVGEIRDLRSAAPASVLLLALLPLVLNFKAASRAHGPDATLARDFSYDLLQSAEPYGIVFTNGDNDTFPLWYLQEVEGVRQDVSVVNLSLGNTDWYIRQLRDNPVRPFDPEQAPWFADRAPETPPGALHRLTDEQIHQLTPTLLPEARMFRAGQMTITYPENSALYIHDMLVLWLIQENWQHRPIYFSLTAGSSNWQRVQDYVTQQALLFRLHVEEPPDTAGLAPGLFGVPMDLPRTEFLAWDVYRYAGLLEGDSVALDPTNRNIAINLSYPLYSLGQAYELLGDREKSLRNLRRALALQPIPEVAQLVEAGADIFRPPPALADTPVARD